MFMIQSDKDYEYLYNLMIKRDNFNINQINTFISNLKKVYKKFVFDEKSGEIIAAIDKNDDLVISDKIEIKHE